MFPRSTILALAIATIASPVLAATVADPASPDTAGQVIAKVSVSDLNLSSPADQDTLRHRIRHAAVHVCTEVTNGPTATDTTFRDCLKQAFAEGWQQAETRIAAAQTRQLVASATR